MGAVGKGLSDVVNSTAGRVVGGIATGGLSELGRAAGNVLTGGGASQEQAPQVPEMDPRVKQMADAQLQQAQQYQANAGDLKQQQGNLAQQGTNQELADKQAGITKNANSRGLLYSGLRQGAMAGARGEAAAGLAGKQSQINQNIDQTAASMNNQALQSQMGVQNLQNQRNALAYNIKNQKENEGGLIGSVGKGLGQVFK